MFQEAHSPTEDKKISAYEPDNVIQNMKQIGENGTLEPTERDYASKLDEYHHNEEITSNSAISDHWRLLKRSEIIIYLVNVVLFNSGAALISVLAYSYYIELGHSHYTASLGMTCNGIGSLTGSIILAMLSVRLSFNRLYMHWFLNLLLVIFLVMFPMVKHDTAMAIVLTFEGCTFGMLCANLGSLTQHINGHRLLHLAYSYEMAAGGIGSFVGPIIGSHLQMVLVLEAGFWFGGSCCAAGLLVMVIFSFLDKSRLKPKDMEETEQDANTVAVVSSMRSLTVTM